MGDRFLPVSERSSSPGSTPELMEGGRRGERCSFWIPRNEILLCPSVSDDDGADVWTGNNFYDRSLPLNLTFSQGFNVHQNLKYWAAFCDSGHQSKPTTISHQTVWLLLSKEPLAFPWGPSWDSVT